MMNQVQRTFLKVFIEVDDNKSQDDQKSDDQFNNSPHATSYGSSNGSLKSNSNHTLGMSSITAQYTIVPITPTSTASEVCAAVARKRHLIYTSSEYELVMCDGDDQRSYQTILEPLHEPWHFQQQAAKHGHLGDFHFVFRKVNDYDDDETDIETDDEPEMFGQMPRQPISSGKYPAAWMEKRGKKHKAWRKRYFVLIGDSLLYYKRKDVYENGKDPIASIELNNPAAIIKILSPETIRRNNIISTLFCFDIHTPKRIYSLRIDNYNDMIYWVRALSRRNEANELLDGLDDLISSSELLHADDDELLMQKFSNIQSILNNNAATDAYMKYLQGIRNEEFLLFYLDLKKYLSDYHISSKDTQKRFAREIYDKYIKSGAKRQLSEIKSKFRSNIKKTIERGLITRDMFDDIEEAVIGYLKRDSVLFFNSNEYFRFIVTYKCIDNQYQAKFSWVDQFEQNIKSINKKKYDYMMSSNQSTLYHHNYHHNGSINIPSSLHSKHTIHSPVLRTGTQRSRPKSPLLSSSSGNNSNSLLAKSWTGNSAFDNDHQNINPYRKSSKNKKKDRGLGKSVFSDAPGLKKKKPDKPDP